MGRHLDVHGISETSSFVTDENEMRTNLYRISLKETTYLEVIAG